VQFYFVQHFHVIQTNLILEAEHVGHILKIQVVYVDNARVLVAVGQVLGQFESGCRLGETLGDEVGVDLVEHELITAAVGGMELRDVQTFADVADSLSVIADFNVVLADFLHYV